MSDPHLSSDLLADWQRTVQQGLEAWQALSVPSAQAAAAVWQQMFAQGMDMWARLGGQELGASDALTAWKRMMDASVETWSKSLEGALASHAAASFMGRTLEQSLNVLGPVRRNVQAMSEDVLRAANLPSRKQVTRVGAGVIAMDERVEALDDRLDTIEAQLRVILDRLSEPREPASPTAEDSAKPSPASSARRRGGKEVE